MQGSDLQTLGKTLPALGLSFLTCKMERTLPLGQLPASVTQRSGWAMYTAGDREPSGRQRPPWLPHPGISGLSPTSDSEQVLGTEGDLR